MRENCGLDQVIGDMLKFCEKNCESKMLLGRVMMNGVADVWKELMQLLLDPVPPATLRAEASKLQALGEQVGKLIRVAVGFDLFTAKPNSKYADLLEDDDDEDFAD